MKPFIREMTLDDHEAALALWQRCEGIGLTGADSRAGVAAFFKRNPGLSLVAEADGALIGTALCGHDGRRGFIYHLAVEAAHRGFGLGRGLVDGCLARLHAQGIERCHIVVYADNSEGQAFWRKLGWDLCDTLVIMSRNLTP